MKKLLTLSLALLLVAGLTIASAGMIEGAEPSTPPDGILYSTVDGAATEPYVDPYPLLTEWATNGYPDDIGGYFFDESGAPVILLVNGTPERAAGLQAQVENATVLPAKYSYNEMLEAQTLIQKDLDAQANDQLDIFSVGIGWNWDEQKQQSVGFGDSGKEFRVVVYANENALDALNAKYTEQFNDMVVVVKGQDFRLYDEPVAAPEAMPWLEKWSADGYPDDIGGVVWDDATGKPIVLLVNGTPEREAELKALVGDDVAILPAKYSYNELLALQDSINENDILNQTGDAEIYGCGVGWHWNKDLNTTTGFGDSGKEMRVVINVAEGKLDVYREKYAQYGDKVFVEEGAQMIAMTDGGIPELGGGDDSGRQPLIAPNPAAAPVDAASKPSAFDPLAFTIFAVALAAIVLLAVLLNRRQKGAALQTNIGTIETTPAVSLNQAAQAVQDSKLEPSNEVYEGIKTEIEK